MKIRKVENLEDFDIVFELDQKIFWSIEWGAMKTETEMDNSEWWLVEIDDKPVGYFGVTIMEGHHAFHKRSGILPEYRGKGFQRRSLRIREKYAKLKKCKEVSTYVSVDNPYSLNNLIKCGYLAYVPEDKWGEIEAVYMTKSLG